MVIDISSFYGCSLIITINYEAFLASVLLWGIPSPCHDLEPARMEVRMHSEVSYHLSSVEATYFPHLMSLCHRGLCFAFSFSRGLTTICFVGIITLSKNSASNPDVCGSNLYLRKETERGNSVQVDGQSRCSPSHRRTASPLTEKGGGRRKWLTACWKSVDMPILSSTFSMGRFSFSHTSWRKDSSTWKEERREKSQIWWHFGHVFKVSLITISAFLWSLPNTEGEGPTSPLMLALQYWEGTWRLPITGYLTNNAHTSLHNQSSHHDR